jgi:hypothetical protein
MAWRENRDVEVLIRHYRIPVSSSIMSQTSPEFHKLFTTQHGSLRKWIELPNEDPVAFGIICESAHGSFIPHDDVSLQTLVNMTDAIQRYKIPATSSVHHTAEFSFAIHAFRLGTLSTIELFQLLGVAKALGPTKYQKLLVDVFLQYPLQFEALPMEQITGGCKTDFAMLGMYSVSTSIRRLTNSHSKCEATGCGVPRTSGKHNVEFAGRGLHSPSAREMRLSYVDSAGQPQPTGDQYSSSKHRERCRSSQ